MNLADLVRSIPHHPKPGILFRDLTTLFKDAGGFGQAIGELAARYENRRVDKVAAVEARGFIVGAALAHALATGFVPLRKPGKLPAPTHARDYELEYGVDRLEMHVDALRPGEHVLMVDDLIATGGTAEAAVALVRQAGASIVECAFVAELTGLGGRERVQSLGVGMHALLRFDGTVHVPASVR